MLNTTEIKAQHNYTRAVIAERDALKAELEVARAWLHEADASDKSLRKAAQMALDALEGLFPHDGYEGAVTVWRLGGSHTPRLAIEALRKELA